MHRFADVGRHQAGGQGQAFAAQAGGVALFVAMFCVILSMYGGGFATVPAYLADIFGTQFVGAIHGRLLTAWSTAGVIGPVVVNYIREAQIAAGVPRSAVRGSSPGKLPELHGRNCCARRPSTSLPLDCAP